MIPINKIRSYRREFMASSAFRKMLTFLVFVVIAALFWFIMALNDSAQDDFEVRVAITNVPDSVTFINLPPQKIHVMVRDQGVNLWRSLYRASQRTVCCAEECVRFIGKSAFIFSGFVVAQIHYVARSQSARGGVGGSFARTG